MKALQYKIIQPSVGPLKIVVKDQTLVAILWDNEKLNHVRLNQTWDPLRPKFKNLTVQIFEKSVHSPQYEEPVLFDAEFLKWLKEI